MQPQSDKEYKDLLSEVIKKQIVILGPDITLAKARNVAGLTVDNDGNVTQMTGEPQNITQALIDQFVQLSGMIVKKTMEPLLAYHPSSGQKAPELNIPIPTVTVVPPITTPVSSPSPIASQTPTPPTPTATPPLTTVPVQSTQPTITPMPPKPIIPEPQVTISQPTTPPPPPPVLGSPTLPQSPEPVMPKIEHPGLDDGDKTQQAINEALKQL